MLKLLSRNTWTKLIRNPVRALAAGKHRIVTELSASWLKGYSPFARNLTFFLTYRCNLRCHVCGQWGDTGYVGQLSPEQIRDEVDIATLKQVISEVAPYRPEITLCGGEVLLYSDWFEFMTHVKARGLKCILTTNGTMLEEHAEKLVNVGLDKLSLSLDGTSKIHNAARGRQGAYEKAISAVETINRLKREKHKDKPEVEIGCTISDRNCRHLDELVDVAESLEARCLIFLHLAFLGEDEFCRQSKVFQDMFQTESLHWSGYRYDPGDIEVDSLLAQLAAIKARQSKMPIIVHPDFGAEEIKRYYRGGTFLSRSYSNTCLAPWETLYVLPNGDISPCSSFVAGNIREERLVKIWNNGRFRHFRRELRKRRFFPACPRCCEFYKH